MITKIKSKQTNCILNSLFCLDFLVLQGVLTLHLYPESMQQIPGIAYDPAHASGD